MTRRSNGEVANAWWQSIAFRANRWYALGIMAAMLVAFGMPHVLSSIVPCAQYMEVEWLMVGGGCLAALGLLNISFSFAPAAEHILPQCTVKPVRVFVLMVVPVLVLVSLMYVVFEPFWYALMNNPDLLCD